MKRGHVLLAVGLAVSAGLAIFGDKTPDSSVAEPTARSADRDTTSPSARPAGVQSREKHKGPVKILALEPRATLIGRAGGPPSPGLFTEEVEAPPPPPPAASENTPPPAPTLPPLPFTYLGKKFENAKWEVYLAIGDETYFVREGSVIDKKYAVNAIKPPTMTLTFLPMRQMQTLTIGEAD